MRQPLSQHARNVWIAKWSIKSFMLTHNLSRTLLLSKCFPKVGRPNGNTGKHRRKENTFGEVHEQRCCYRSCLMPCWASCPPCPWPRILRFGPAPEALRFPSLKVFCGFGSWKSKVLWFIVFRLWCQSVSKDFNRWFWLKGSLWWMVTSLIWLKNWLRQHILQFNCQGFNGWTSRGMSVACCSDQLETKMYQSCQCCHIAFYRIFCSMLKLEIAKVGRIHLAASNSVWTRRWFGVSYSKLLKANAAAQQAKTGPPPWPVLAMLRVLRLVPQHGVSWHMRFAALMERSSWSATSECWPSWKTCTW